MSSNTVNEELPIDENIVSALPTGTKVQSIRRHAISNNSITAKITAVDDSDRPTPFFLKYVTGSLAESQIEGEFTGMMELHTAAPDLVPRPIARGRLQASVDEKKAAATTTTYFLIMEFKDFLPPTELPDPSKLCPRLAAMHRRSAQLLPPSAAAGGRGGRFGYGIQTYDGSRPQAVLGWEDRWALFFARLLAEAYRQDVETNGVWPELDAAHARVQSRLVPRLLGALEADTEERNGRGATTTATITTITPVLIHGDLWDGNVGVERATGDPWIYDCGVYWAHHEMELGIWRAERHRLNAEAYREEYFRHFEPSEPREEYDDRVRLYSAKTNFMHSAIFPGSGGV